MKAWPRIRLSRELLLGGLLAMVLALYFAEALQRRTAVPTPAKFGDQDAYLEYARQMSLTHHQTIGDRNRMPVYPFLLSLLYRPRMSEAQFLAVAQAANIYLSLLILLALLVIYRRYLPRTYGAALVVAIAFGVFVNRAGNARAELLFYLLSFALFLSCWQMLRRPTLLLAICTGALAGLAHLTKASVLPGLLIFAIAFVAKFFQKGERTAPLVRRNLAALVLVAAAFLLVVFPYLQTSKRVFGRYFYNVNSTFYFWCDSWSEALALTAAHGDSVGWPRMPAQEIPSRQKYWREHSLAQIAGRVGNGSLRLVRHNVRIDGYYKYAAFLALVAALLAARRRRQFQDSLGKHWPLALFLGGYFLGYFILYAWYAPISIDSRFVLALLLPFTFIASRVIFHLAPPASNDRLLRTLCLTLLIFAAIDFVHTDVWFSGRTAATSSISEP